MNAIDLVPETFPLNELANARKLVAEIVATESPSVELLGDAGRTLGFASYLTGRLAESVAAATGAQVATFPTNLAGRLGVEVRTLAKVGGIADASAAAGRVIELPGIGLNWRQEALSSIDLASEKAKWAHDSYVGAGLLST